MVISSDLKIWFFLHRHWLECTRRGTGGIRRPLRTSAISSMALSLVFIEHWRLLVILFYRASTGDTWAFYEFILPHRALRLCSGSERDLNTVYMRSLRWKGTHPIRRLLPGPVILDSVCLMLLTNTIYSTTLEDKLQRRLPRDHPSLASRSLWWPPLLSLLSRS